MPGEEAFREAAEPIVLGAVIDALAALDEDDAIADFLTEAVIEALIEDLSG